MENYGNYNINDIVNNCASMNNEVYDGSEPANEDGTKDTDLLNMYLHYEDIVFEYLY